MKKLLILLLFLPILANAQSFEFLGGENCKLFFENTIVENKSTTFAYLELDKNGMLFSKIFREQRIENTPIFAHAEYQTSFRGNNTFVAGLGFYIFSKHGFVELMPAYRYSNSHYWNASIIYLYNTKHLEFYGFHHFFGTDNISFLIEERVHLKIDEHFKVGIVFDLNYFGKLQFTPMLGLRYDIH